ncbi:MAG TPA: D-glycerate dehydrogenase [Candidatus Cloacimonadota bacterium]|nr:D-glycerate dehydrogenase [Candidatus Cloacimonadota bacterium]
MPANIYVTRRIPQAAIDLLSSYFDVSVNPFERNLRRAELLEHVKDADAILCLLSDSIDRSVMDAAPRLKCISNYAVGYNNIDVEYASKQGIVVCNTPKVLTETTADLTWALIMSCARRIVESDSFLRSGEFKGWEPMLLMGADIHHKTLGIIGMGRIGQAVAKRASGFGMRVLAYDPSLPEDHTTALWKSVDLLTLLREADFVSLHVPLTEKTQHMIGPGELKLMKRGAILINTSRGAVINESALIEALRQNRIAAAGLDVYEKEPYIPQELLELKNVVLLPHIGSATTETRTAMGIMAAQNAIAVLKGEEPPSRIN